MCTGALEQRRYSWRHDSVLNTLQPELLKHFETWNESKEVKSNKMIFVKAGERKAKTNLAALLITSFVVHTIGDFK